MWILKGEGDPLKSGLEYGSVFSAERPRDSKNFYSTA